MQRNSKCRKLGLRVERRRFPFLGSCTLSFIFNLVGLVLSWGEFTICSLIQIYLAASWPSSCQVTEQLLLLDLYTPSTLISFVAALLWISPACPWNLFILQRDISPGISSPAGAGSGKLLLEPPFQEGIVGQTAADFLTSPTWPCVVYLPPQHFFPCFLSYTAFPCYTVSSLRAGNVFPFCICISGVNAVPGT